MRTLRAPTARQPAPPVHERSAGGVPDARTVWRENRHEAVDFRDARFRTRGLEWPSDYCNTTNPSLPLNDFHRGLIDAIPGTGVTLLDVAAGPLTIFGKVSVRKHDLS